MLQESDHPSHLLDLDKHSSSVEHNLEQVSELASRGLLGSGDGLVGLVDSSVDDAVKAAVQPSLSDGLAGLAVMPEGVTASTVTPKSAVRDALASEPRLQYDPNDLSHDAWYHMPEPLMASYTPPADTQLNLPAARSSRASKGKPVMFEEPT